MSLAATQAWIKAHLQPFPAIPLYAQQAHALIKKTNFNKKELSNIIASDPGLSIQLFNQLNAKRKGTKRDYIESIQSGLTLMGDAGIIQFINKITTLDDIRTSFDCEHDYLQLVARAQHAAKHAKLWGKKRQSQGVKEIAIATRLYDIAQFALCLFDYEHFCQFKQLNTTHYNPDKTCQKILGFSLNELSSALCEHTHLPELVQEAHNRHYISGMRSQGIKIAAELAHQADISWYQDATLDYLIQAADLCQLPIDKITSLAHLSCVEAARELDFKVHFHAAANLVQHHAPPRPKVVRETPLKPLNTTTAKPDIKPTLSARPDVQKQLLNELKSIAQNKTTTQAQQLNALLSGCYKHLKTRRNALFLLSQDRTKLTTRLHKGLANDSALLKFSVATKQAGLLKILLEKPQAIWINPDNFQRYEAMLPGIFKSCSLSDDFFMMSLFSGKKAIGIVFCDNHGSKQALDKQCFDSFKKAVGLSAKAMLFISQRTNANKNN